jgi:hypothetical protein
MAGRAPFRAYRRLAALAAGAGKAKIEGALSENNEFTALRAVNAMLKRRR